MGKVKCKNALGQSDRRILKLYYFKNCCSYKINFVPVGTYLFKLQIDNVILGRRGEVWPGIPKEAIITLQGPI